MKITKQQLKQIIKEELEELPQADAFTDRLSLSMSIRDAIIGHLENENLFKKGEIPQSVIKVVENSSLRIADATKEVDQQHRRL